MGETGSEELSVPITTPDNGLKAEVVPVVEQTDMLRTEQSVFPNSEVMRMVEAQRQLGLPPTIVHVDIDNTFFRGDRENESRLLATSCHEANIALHAVTGNGFNQVFERIQRGELPYFPVISSAVGTERYVLHGSGSTRHYVRDVAYDEKLAQMGFDRLTLTRNAQQMIAEGKNPQWQLDFQKPEQEARFAQGGIPAHDGQKYKLSFYCFSEGEKGLEQIQQTMESRFPGQQVVICEEIGHNSRLGPEEKRKKYCLDVLPITKADAVTDVAAIVGTQISIVAGDSGNDIRMLQGAGDVSIVVGGAKPELLTSITREMGGSPRGRFVQAGQKWYFRDTITKFGGDRRGPESIIHVLRVLARAALIHQEQQPDTRREIRRIYDSFGQKESNEETITAIYYNPEVPV